MPVTEETIARLRSILNQISLGSVDDYYRIGAQIRDAKDEVLAKYRPIFSMDNLNNLTADDFKGFLLFKNNQHWDSLHRQGGWMTEDMNKLRSALKILMDEPKPIEKRLNNWTFAKLEI
jgi:H2-forming N5,N10-methylenetetrahydromethanopterin dehydrogenase-like enzyme